MTVTRYRENNVGTLLCRQAVRQTSKLSQYVGRPLSQTDPSSFGGGGGRDGCLGSTHTKRPNDVVKKGTNEQEEDMRRSTLHSSQG
jgi:hypothetical protein